MYPLQIYVDMEISLIVLIFDRKYIKLVDLTCDSNVSCHKTTTTIYVSHESIVLPCNFRLNLLLNIRKSAAKPNF